jgi:hypothetical protein
MVTLQQAKDHMGITTAPGDLSDAMLQLKLDAAEAIVLNYIKNDAPDPSPLLLAAILLQFGELHRFRGDDVEGQGPAQTDGDLSPVVTNILRRYRDPALA